MSNGKRIYNHTQQMNRAGMNPKMGPTPCSSKKTTIDPMNILCLHI